MMKKIDHIVFLTAKEDNDRFLDKRIFSILNKDNYSIIPNATHFPTSSCENVTEFKNVFGNKNIAISVGSYYSLKNQKLVLDSFLDSDTRNWMLVFCGQEKNRYYKKLVASAKRRLGENFGDRVLFISGLGGKRLGSIYDCADLFIYGSKTECQPLVILEAMAHGVPFISTNVGCVSQMRGGVTVRNKKEMIEKINLFTSDKSLREFYGSCGVMEIENYYNWNKVSELLSATINNIVNSAQ